MFQKNFLIIGFAAMFLIGLTFPQPGVALRGVRLGPVTVSQITISMAFLVSGLLLGPSAEAFQPKATILGLVLIVLVTPCMAWPIINLGFLDLPLLQGLAIFTLTPTTMVMGPVCVTNAKGNTALAILLCMVTNVIGVFTLSFTVSQILNAEVGISIGETLLKMICFALTPLLIGLGSRRAIAQVDELAKSYKQELTYLQGSCLLLNVLMMISSAQRQIIHTPVLDIILCLVLGIVLHLVLLLICGVSATICALPPKEWVCVAIMGSQKQLPMCVAILSVLPESFDFGQLLMPIMFAHCTQLFIDTFLSSRWEIVEEAPPEKFSTIFGAPSKV